MGATQFVTYTTRDGKLRLYDGSATPYYIELPFVQADFRAPTGRPRGEQIAVLDRGRLSALMHYVEGPDDPILQPVQLSFSFRLANMEPNLTKFREAMNTNAASAFTVGGHTWVSTKGKTQLMGGGGSPALWTTPTFLNTPVVHTINVEVLWVDPTLQSGDTGYKYAEVWFRPSDVTVSDGDAGVMLAATGQVYGTITGISAFTSGVAG